MVLKLANSEQSPGPSHCIERGEVPTAFSVAGCPLPPQWRGARYPLSGGVPTASSVASVPYAIRGSRP